MAAAGPGGPGPDLYQLLGVARHASRREIAHAWRQRARAEHPDARRGDAAAPGRFGALARAWHVLGDPVRRAAYDQALGHDAPPAAAAPPARAPRQARGTPMMRSPGPALWAGPVRVEAPRPMSGTDGRDEQDIELAMLTLRYLTRDWGWPW